MSRLVFLRANLLDELNKPYVVTLTVSDISGAKRPVMVESTVEVID